MPTGLGGGKARCANWSQLKSWRRKLLHFVCKCVLDEDYSGDATMRELLPCVVGSAGLSIKTLLMGLLGYLIWIHALYVVANDWTENKE